MMNFLSLKQLKKQTLSLQFDDFFFSFNGMMSTEGEKFWAIWGVLMAIVIVIILCFCYFNQDADSSAATDGRSAKN